MHAIAANNYVDEFHIFMQLQRQQQQTVLPQQRAGPEYEEVVELKENAAYGPVQNIELKACEAYVPVQH